MKKYKLGESKIENGITLYRVIALIAFSDVSIGDVGGWVESEENLAHYGNAWVYDNARVYGNARVFGNAGVYDNARVYGNARVFGDARVSGNAQVYSDARVFGDAQVYGDARVYGNAWVSGNAQVYDNAWVTKQVITIQSNKYHITISDNYIAIGCQNHIITYWLNFSDTEISEMDTGALEWWKIWKPIIFAAVEANK